MSFNSSINKLDYFEKLLHDEHNSFNAKINKCVNNQKELVKKIRQIQKTTKEVRNQSNILNYAKVHVQLE